jgi:hypothetical protein
MCVQAPDAEDTSPAFCESSLNFHCPEWQRNVPRALGWPDSHQEAGTVAEN